MPTNAEPDALVDTSVAVALVTSDHPAHREVVAALTDRRLGLAGHAAFETFSVLTRLPSPLRRAPKAAQRLLTENFPHTRFLDEESMGALLLRLAVLRLGGGAVYDALVGAAAAHHGLPLVSRDRRATPTYRALEVELELLA